MWSLSLTPRVAFTTFLILMTLCLIGFRLCYHSSDALITGVRDAYMDEGDVVEHHVGSSACSNSDPAAGNASNRRSPIPTLNSYLKPFLACQRKPNKQGQILLSPRHLNISLQHDKFSPPQNLYFNPAIIPLPSYAASLTSARYLLVTRLVTSGLHQESHACLARFCLPSFPTDAANSPTSSQNSSTQQRHLPPDTSACTTEDDGILGPGGGLRCIHPPNPLNIPPTPSMKCSDKWSPFPDIPGFHDPRIMWSGRGEPLILVNSGSTYGCLGLWMMDLRVLIAELRDILERRRPENNEKEQSGGEGDLRNRDADGRQGEKRSGTPWWKMPVLRFDTLTELTRWEGRAEVEKNWMLWWPGDGRSTRVSYEMFGRWQEVGMEREHVMTGNKAGDDDDDAQVDDVASNEVPELRHAGGGAEGLQGAYHGRMPWPVWNVSQSLNISHTGFDPNVNESTTPAGEKITLENTHTPIGIYNPSSASSAPLPKLPPLNTTIARHAPQTDSKPIKKRSPPSPIRSSPSSHRLGDTTPSPSIIHPKPKYIPHHTFHRGRSISHLHHASHHIVALPNGTHPDEPPCLLPPDLPTSSSKHQSRQASTHQSTPALRLILCQRQDPSCAAIPHSSGPTTTSAKMEREWLESGREVHFSIVHRKLRPENPLGLVERGGYERWVVVWEGRAPGRIVAVGRHALAFEGEGWGNVAAPSRATADLTKEKRAGYEGADKEPRPAAAAELGFVYTTSISWAWRVDGGPGRGGSGSDGTREGDADADANADAVLGHLIGGDVAHLSGLGTGFLGDDVILGIGIDDSSQAVVRVRVDELLSCLTLCPGVSVDNENVN